MTIETLKVVPPERIREVWPLIRERISALSVDAAEPWMAEDVFADLVGARSFLWVTEECRGFIIVSTWTAPFARDLHVWIACNDMMDNAAAYLPEVKRIAKVMNCWRVVWESPRRWERALPGVSTRYLYSIDLGG